MGILRYRGGGWGIGGWGVKRGFCQRALTAVAFLMLPPGGDAFAVDFFNVQSGR